MNLKLAKLEPTDTMRFQVTTLEAWSQFSRVADRSIIAGLVRADISKRVAHLSVEQRMTLWGKLNNGHATTYTDTDGKLCVVSSYRV